jgi:thiopurine S-methyltransferase
MQAAFWHERWQQNQLGFHLNETNPLLLKHINALALKAGSRICIPLCGKTLDIEWLLGKGYQIVGVELSAIAIDQLFTSLGLVPTISQIGEMTQYSADGITIFVGDIFNVSAEMLGQVDAIFDRAALVALPETMRIEYAKHLMQITNSAKQLLVCIDYDQTVLNGPPFSINTDKVNAYYRSAYNLKQLQVNPIEGGLKGKCAADEVVWLLEKQT